MPSSTPPRTSSAAPTSRNGSRRRTSRLWRLPVSSAEDADQHAAGDDQQRAGEQMPANELVPADHEPRSDHAEERLRRDERADNGHAAARERLEEERVRDAE